MNNNLVREQRPDKHGKMVTRLVRALSPTKAGKTGMPAPSLVKQSADKTPTFKTRPKQREQNRTTGIWKMHRLDPELEATGNVSKNHYFAFTASEEEIYSVLSVTPEWGDAIKLMMEGVRTEEEARAYLSKHKLDRLAGDRSALTQSALRKNMRPDDLIQYGSMIRSHHDPDNAIDGILFAVSPLAENNLETQEDILEGKVSYEDIKRIGATRLKPWGRLKYLRPLLRELHSGGVDYTVDDLKQVVERFSSERLEGHYMEGIADLIQNGGIETIKATKDLYRPAMSVSNYQSKASRGAIKAESLYERAIYAITVTDEASPRIDSGVYVVDEYYDAGIPVDITIEMMRKGGSVEEALLLVEARKNGIHGDLGEGWL